uniref:Zinc finger protein 259 n=1 Tax=Pan troglodytes TaxID=9598 RepID=A0A2I3RN75_PANTR
MAASGAVEPGPPGAAVAPSPAPAPPPAPDHLFRPISAEDEEQQPTEIESLCMNCYCNGMTRLLLTKIPFFREIIVSSFSCEHCGWNNTEIQSAGRIQDQGVRYTLSVRALEDMNREVVKTDSAATRIPELDFEIPAFSQKGALTTVEGLITRAISGLEQDQPARRANKDATAERIDEFIVKLKELKQVASPFTLIIDDPSGNSFVENPHAPQKDDALVITYYNRTRQQEEMLGLQEEAPAEKPEEEDLRNEVLQFNTNCPECNAPAQTNMKLVQIPHFKEVIIMATNCENCGHRTNEVGGRHYLGRRLSKFNILLLFNCIHLFLKKTLLVEKDPFKLFKDKTPMFYIIEGNMKAHFIMDDPAGNSYLQNVYAPEDDPEMKVERYKRTFDQNEELGLNDMKTEGYEAGLAPQR